MLPAVLRKRFVANKVLAQPSISVDVKTLTVCMRIVLAAVVIQAMGCAEVAFHEKERLNDRIMSFDDDPAADSMRQHMITPREGAIGGYSTVGAGGCACK